MAKLVIFLSVAALCVCMAMAQVNAAVDEAYQAEKAATGEIRYTAQEDLAQTRANQEITSADELRSLKFPTEIPAAEAQKLVDQSRTSGVSVSQAVNPYLAYQEQVNLQVLSCCPKTQNYQCRSTYQNMPCFYYTPSAGRREVCCPIGTQRQVRNCNCRTCAVMEPRCISLGQCLRRWSRRYVNSFCYNFSAGTVAFRRIYRYVPSSCYCRKTSCNPRSPIDITPIDIRDPKPIEPIRTDPGPGRQIP